MKYSWATNLYDYEGDSYEDCILVFCGEETILRFKTPGELKQFANEILRSLPEVEENLEE